MQAAATASELCRLSIFVSLGQVLTSVELVTCFACLPSSSLPCCPILPTVSLFSVLPPELFLHLEIFVLLWYGI